MKDSAGSRVPYLTQTEWNAVKQFKESLLSEFGEEVLHFRIFGSHARGDAEPGSDVDIFVCLKTLDKKKRDRVYDLACDAWLANDFVPLAPLVFSEEHMHWHLDRETGLIMDIMAEGISLL